jgi:hypothetical protein
VRRHTVLCVEHPAGDPWASYARTVVEISGPASQTLIVQPDPAGRAGAWPWPAPDPVHVLTAWDPGGERPGDHVNRERQASLEGDLRPLAHGLWRTVGVDPVTGHREEGVAVTGLADTDAVTLGARYRQDAIFRWDPEAWVVVSCADDRRLFLGWTVEIR